MKKLMITLAFALVSIGAFAQSNESVPTQFISPDSAATYRLFATDNMYNFILLNTANGKMKMVQWSTEYNNRLTASLNYDDLRPFYIREDSTAKLTPGRFFLYPTTNTWTFILVDQIDGRTWQVQWAFKEEERGVWPIY